MRPSLRLAPLPLLLGLLLTGCGSYPRPMPTVALRVPASLLVCTSQPPVPEIVNDADLAGFITDLAGAGQDCREKLKAVGELQGP